MGFIMDGLEAEDYDRHYSDQDLLRRIMGYFRPKAAGMAVVAVAIVATTLMQAVLPLLVSWGLDRIDGPSSTRTMVLLIGGILASGVLAWVFNFLRQLASARVVGDVVMRLRDNAFRAVLNRDMSFFDDTPTGRVVSRVTSDTDDFANVVKLTMELVSQVLLVSLVTALLFTRDVGLALLTLCVTPVIVALALLFRRVARDSTRQSQRSVARVNSTLQETLGGITVAKSFRQEQTLYDEFGPINRQSYRVRLRQGFVFASIFPLLLAVAGLATAALVWIGGDRVAEGGLTAGDWYLFIQAVGLFWGPLTSIASFWSQFQQGLAAAERVFALVDAEPLVVQHDHQPVGRLAGRVEFDGVIFAYTPERRVLDHFDLTIEAGETVALVGHTGAGKSTLGRLVTRFYEYAGGRLLIDGRDIRTLDLADYRRQVGVVPQTPFLFSGTVADNIGYPRPGVTREELVAAAANIAGGDWVDALPEGLETKVGEHGRSLSTGQRQLVALARLLIQDPAIVILDEATASVDPLTEAQIQEGLDVVLAGRTSIVIAHRLSTIEHVDRIIVLDHGRIVEEGNHRALLRAGGAYAGVYNAYFRHQSPHYQPGTGFVPVAATPEPTP